MTSRVKSPKLQIGCRTQTMPQVGAQDICALPRDDLKGFSLRLVSKQIFDQILDVDRL